MADRIRAGLTAAQGRKFAFTVGGAFFVFAAITWWRQHPTMMTVFASLGGAFAVAGLVAPTALGPVERAWMGLAHLISKVTTPIFMGIVYFVVLTPISLGMRLAGRRPMVHEAGDMGFWFDRGAAKPEPARMERQF